MYVYTIPGFSPVQPGERTDSNSCHFVFAHLEGHASEDRIDTFDTASLLIL